MTLRIKKNIIFSESDISLNDTCEVCGENDATNDKKGSLYTSVIITLMESVCHFFSESFAVSYFVICATKEHILNVLN